MFGPSNATWNAAASLREAAQLADYIVLRSGMTQAFGRVVFESQKDLMAHVSNLRAGRRLSRSMGPLECRSESQHSERLLRRLKMSEGPHGARKRHQGWEAIEPLHGAPGMSF